MLIRLTVDFDTGMAGQQALGALEEDHGNADGKDTENKLIATWNSPSDSLIEAAIEEFNSDDAILNINLYKDEDRE